MSGKGYKQNICIRQNKLGLNILRGKINCIPVSLPNGALPQSLITFLS